MTNAHRPLWLLVLAAACGGRSEGEWPGASPSGESSGTSSVETGGNGSGGAFTVSGGFPTLGGAAATGGVATGGVATGGVPSGGVPTGGVATGGVATGGSVSGGTALGGAAAGGVAAGGRTTGGQSSGGRPCFETTQATDSLCIHVRLCSEAQYETLCLLDTPTSAVCFCYTDGSVTSAASVQSASYESLCAEAERSRCPLNAE